MDKISIISDLDGSALFIMMTGRERGQETATCSSKSGVRSSDNQKKAGRIIRPLSATQTGTPLGKQWITDIGLSLKEGSCT